MSTALVPGCYHPVHVGHVDVIERVARHFDQVIAAVVQNPSKQGMFSLEERMELMREALAHVPNIEIDAYSGLTVDYASSHGIRVIVKGLRAISDFDFELQQAFMNQALTGVDTLFMPTSTKTSFLSSTLIKEVARLGGDISGLVPPNVQQRMKEKFSS